VESDDPLSVLHCPGEGSGGIHGPGPGTDRRQLSGVASRLAGERGQMTSGMDTWHEDRVWKRECIVVVSAESPFDYFPHLVSLLVWWSNRYHGGSGRSRGEGVSPLILFTG